MIFAVRCGLVLERLAAIGGAEPVLVTNEHEIGVVGIDAKRGVVEWPGGQLAVTIHQIPREATIVGTIEAGAGLGLDQGIEPVRRRGGHADIGAPEQAVWQTARQLGPRVAAIDRLVEAAILAAGGDGPRPADAVPHGGIKGFRIVGRQLQIGCAQRLVDEKYLGPRLAAVAGAIDAAILAISKGVAGAGHEHFIRIGRVDADG